MKKRYTVLWGLLFLLCRLLPALDWPLPDAVMVRNFGLNDQGRPVLGTVFEGEGDIFAADEGELIFSSSGKEFASRLPFPLGAWTAVDHGDGLISIYGRHDANRTLKAEPEDITRYAANYIFERPMSRVDSSVSIAGAGSSGWSKRNGLFFMLFDRKERRWINPSMVITPFPDTTPPQILGVQLRREDGRLLEAGQLRNVSQGRYTIRVNTIDTLLEPKETPLAPHRISCSVNGEEAGTLVFETICAIDGVLMVNRNGPIPALPAYAAASSYEAGEVTLSRGQAILEIIVQDIAGNSRSTSIRMIVE